MNVLKLVFTVGIIIISLKGHSETKHDSLRVEKKFMGYNFYYGSNQVSKTDVKSFLKEDRVAYLLFKRGRRANFYSCTHGLSGVAGVGSQSVMAITSGSFYPVILFGGIADFIISIFYRSYSSKNMYYAMHVGNVHGIWKSDSLMNLTNMSPNHKLLSEVQKDTTNQYLQLKNNAELEQGDVIRFKQFDQTWKYGYVAKFYNQQNVGIGIYKNQDDLIIIQVESNKIERVVDKQGKGISINLQPIGTND